MSLYGIFLRSEWNGPTYVVGLYSTEQGAEDKLKEQIKYDIDNGTGYEELYYILEVPYDGKASFEREDKSHVCLDI